MPLVCARANISVMRALSSKACLSLSIALCATAAAALLGAFAYAETACQVPGVISARNVYIVHTHAHKHSLTPCACRGRRIMRPRASTHANTQTRMHRYNDTLIIVKGRTCWIARAREASACRNQASEEKERGRGDHTLCVLRVVLRNSAADRRHQLNPRNALGIPPDP
jgi:hypothetical protein